MFQKVGNVDVNKIFATMYRDNEKYWYYGTKCEH